MKTYFVTFLLAFLSSLILVRVAQWIGVKLNIQDVSWGRKVHVGSIPRLGGPAIAISFFIPIYALLLWDNNIAAEWRGHFPQAMAILIGGIGSVLMGLWDDIFHLRARYKLIAGQKPSLTKAYIAFLIFSRPCFF